MTVLTSEILACLESRRGAASDGNAGRPRYLGDGDVLRADASEDAGGRDSARAGRRLH